MNEQPLDMPQSEDSRAAGRKPLAPIDELKRGTNYLFAIGINTYENFKTLSNARKDIEDIADVLVKDYYFDRNNIQFLCDEDATKANIIEGLDALSKKLKADDRLLIYYSGHGLLEGKRGFWIPVNAERERVATYIANAEVRDIIQSIEARHILLISDSCFSANLLVRDATRDIGGAFMDWERNPSRWIFISGKGVVSDGTAGENSPFAKAILKHLRQNKAEALNIVLLANHVTTEVRFGYAQQAELSPLYQSGHEGGQFVFLKRQTEKDDWQAALSQDTEGAYLSYLNQYPNGEFEKEAEQKLVHIADEKEWQVATRLDAAFAYRQYLRNYRQGNHANEAQAQLDVIAEVESRQRIEREAERLAKIEADKKEAERLAKIEADKRHAEHLTKIEADKKEAEHLAKIEADKKEAERIAKIEADKKEAERIAKIESDKKEAERIAKIKADKKEQQRLAKLEADRKEAERVAQLLKAQQEAETPTLSPFKKYRLPIIGSGVVATGLLIWQLNKSPEVTPSVSEPIKTENGVQPPVNNPNTNSQKGVDKINATMLPPNVTVQKPVKQPTTDPKAAADKLAAQKREADKAAAIEAERIRKEKEANTLAEQNRQAQAAEAERRRIEKEKQEIKTKVRDYLGLAAAKAQTGNKDKALQYLNSAEQVSGLPSSARDMIKLAKAKVESGDYTKAIDWINKAKEVLN